MPGLTPAGTGAPAAKDEKCCGAAVPARLRGAIASVAQAFQPVRPHRQAAGATTNFSGQPRLSR